MRERGPDEAGMFEKRPYFVIGDLLSNAGAGAVVGAAVAQLVGDGWPLPAGMVAGMVSGGLLATILASAASLLFGALEVMLPVMTSWHGGRDAGWHARRGRLRAGAGGGGCRGPGVAVLAATYILNARLRARGTRWTS